jgi:hypothetical protein
MSQRTIIKSINSTENFSENRKDAQNLFDSFEPDEQKNY